MFTFFFHFSSIIICFVLFFFLNQRNAAFLDSLRPPGSPRITRSDLSLIGQGSAGGSSSGVSSDLSNVDREVMNEEQYARMDIDIDAERIRDRSAYEKFLKIHVRHITDGQGVVAGVLLVTPNTVMFDPNVSDPLVIEHGAEAYGVIAPMEFVVNAALYPDIAHMRLADSKGQPDQPITDPIYFPTNCPLHRKYAILKEKASLKLKEDQTAPEVAADLDPAAGILAIAGTSIYLYIYIYVIVLFPFIFCCFTFPPLFSFSSLLLPLFFVIRFYWINNNRISNCFRR